MLTIIYCTLQHPKGELMLYQNQNDETLVMLTLAGEQSAYEVLVLRYQNAVISAASAITRNRFMAEDAAQDAFVTAWMKLNTLMEAKKFGAWVCRIAKNCALNTVMRMKSFVSFDDVDNIDTYADTNSNPAELYELAEGKRELHGVVDKLPAKIKQIISLHYFEGLSIADIAEKMSLSQGTVKWQLHDGRKRIRKELCAMNENINDTLTERVMKKVEELALWQVKSDKSGFEKVYTEVLAEVEALPESNKKYHAMADVLMRGWWWIPGDKNDALFARIKESALIGKNDEVMEFIVSREDSKVYGGAKIDFIRDKQIPMLEKAGFTKALAREWFWLGYYCFDNYRQFKKDYTEKGREAFAKVQKILSPEDSYYTLAPLTLKMWENICTNYTDRSAQSYSLRAVADEIRYIDGNMCLWSNDIAGEGYLNSANRESNNIFRISSLCDGMFFRDDLSVGETFIASPTASITYVSDNETVDTPSGIFDACRLWETNHRDKYSISKVKTYYKEGVGIVKVEYTNNGFTDVRTLTSYNVSGGKGLIPIANGNTWSYSGNYDPEKIISEATFTVTFANSKKVMIASSHRTERFAYDENSWEDMISQIRNEYCKTTKGRSKIFDVSHAIERAEALASTPFEKAHTKAAASVARRIMATDTEFNPNYTATGHWNFFNRDPVYINDGTVSLCNSSGRWSFEWKCCGGESAEAPLLYNDIIGMLRDSTGYIWSDGWKYASENTLHPDNYYSANIATEAVSSVCDPITTKAGTFDNCIKLSLDVKGLNTNSGLSYRGGKKEYYFAEGIGIVRVVTEYASGAKKSVYELTRYEGTGDGYFPIADGMVRRYDAIGLTDGYVGAAEYTYAADKDGQIYIFADRTGIREIPAPITMYSAIQDELAEDELWNAGKRDESRLRHDINNFKLLLHMLSRDSHSLAKPVRASEIGKYHIRIVEFLAEGGDIPRAWLGRYWRAHFYTACTLFGAGKKEEGYEYLEKAFSLYHAWNDIPDGEALEVGNEHIFGGIKVIKGKGLILLPDGRTEPYDHDYILHPSAGNMYYGMTAPRGWEWFNSVRNEERFKEYIAKARELTEKEDNR